jgi:hypothetical protein
MPAPPTSQRQVALVISPRAAAVLDRTIDQEIGRQLAPSDELDFLVAIRNEIREQLPKAKKKSKKKR